MCREGAWIELTAGVTSVNGVRRVMHTKESNTGSYGPDREREKLFWFLPLCSFYKKVTVLCLALNGYI